MNFRFIKTKDELLKKYLEGFYIFESGTADAQTEYIVFPSNHCVVSIYHNVRLHIESNKIHYSNSPGESVVSTVAIAFQKPLIGTYESGVREISFCFYPLGFNHFVDKDLSGLQRGGLQFFDYEEDFKAFISEILDETDKTVLQEKIEAYWLRKFRDKDFSQLENALDMLNKTDLDISEIADKMGLSRQYLARMFTKHLCKTPSEFRKIFRFRKALQSFTSSRNLTHLTYDNLFYDQSHLIKDFQKLTGMSPKQFFKGNKSLNEGSVNWFFPD
ncbi:helix-turn-helix domain-containing protein [Chryseobacterium vaccae]|uniref:helix-turn-helix domain-containing protein n=1 Tax=Chryseobacterium vaccae TaxID=2604424 RepID=UPI0012952C1E|nr:helix-turn-helix domain-containing protein [Chryseobacterium vaccae]